MYDFDLDIEAKSLKLAEQIRKLQEEKKLLDEKLETEKQRLDLARKVGMLIVNEFEGKPFEYDEFKALVDNHFTDDFERTFFGLAPLSADDPRRPKRRGRRKKNEMETETTAEV
jgi:hypothetical protein